MVRTIFLYLQSNKKRAVCIASIWTVLILLACFIPGTTLPKVQIQLADKWVHFFIFAGFSFLWYFVCKKVNIINGLLLIAVATLTGYGVECIQGSGWVKNRSYEFNDVIADAIGGILGVLLFSFCNYYFHKKTQ